MFSSSSRLVANVKGPQLAKLWFWFKLQSQMKASAEQVLFLYSTCRPDLIVPEDAVQLKDGASAKYRGNMCLRANQSRFRQRCGGINAALW